jgi:hypothetical protein
MSFEIRVDCPACRVEGARVEIWDSDAPSCRLGVAESAQCRFCRQAARGIVLGSQGTGSPTGCPACGGHLPESAEAAACRSCGAYAELEIVLPEALPESTEDLEAILGLWGREEGLPSAQDLIDAYFVLPNASEIFACFVQGAPVETTFDVADYLFSGGGGAGAATGEPAVIRVDPDAAPHTQRLPPVSLRASLRPVGGPREEMLALASVAAADGDANEEDRAVLIRAARKRGLLPLSEEDIRVWRPNELEPPATLVKREELLEEMFQMGWADGQLDESELRVIRSFSQAWGIDPERLREWTELYSFSDANAVERWFRRIGFFLFPGR